MSKIINEISSPHVRLCVKSSQWLFLQNFEFFFNPKIFLAHGTFTSEETHPK